MNDYYASLVYTIIYMDDSHWRYALHTSVATHGGPGLGVICVSLSRYCHMVLPVT